ncbi:MAG: hypothetical protein RLZZ385_493 [Pseudomonadota bacterium]|jgi:CHAD domain-containing protein
MPNTNQPPSVESSWCGIFTERLETLRRRLSEYCSSPDEASIHGVRTAFRRLQATYSIIPAACRRQETKRFMEDCKSFFRHNSAIRDCDVMMQKLPALGIAENSELLAILLHKRETLTEQTMDIARRLNKTQPPKLNPVDVDLAPHYVATLRKQINRFMRLRPLVLREPANPENVHTMRKVGKRIHYLLELDPDLRQSSLLQDIKRFQQLSGDIHDCDVTLAYLAEYTNLFREAVTATENLRRRRQSDYERLCEFIVDDRWLSLQQLFSQPGSTATPGLTNDHSV